MTNTKDLTNNTDDSTRFLSKKLDVKYFILSIFASGIPYFVNLQVPVAWSLCPFELHSDAYYCKRVNL